MTTVYRTCVDLSEMSPSALFAALLVVFPLPVVFVASGLGMFVFAGISRYVPRGM